MMFLELFGGLIWLLLAGDLLVRGAVALARRAGIPPVVVGLTIVAFGTSAPELCISISSAFQGISEVAIGNVVGSNIANVLFVLGLPALVTPTAFERESIGWDLVLLLVASVAFVGFCLHGPIGPGVGLVLLLGIGVTLARSARQAGRAPEDQAAAAEELERVLGLPSRTPMIALFLILGCVGLPLGADLMLGGAVQIAAVVGVSNAIIGLSVVALGTSLPELATTVVAALHRNADVALGNIVGSNLFNLLAVLGLTALIAPEPIPVPPSFPILDLPVMLASTAVLTWLIWFHRGIGRLAGALLIAAYALYLYALYAGLGTP